MHFSCHPRLGTPDTMIERPKGSANRFLNDWIV
jgi:hypothetical protein